MSHAVDFRGRQQVPPPSRVAGGRSLSIPRIVMLDPSAFTIPYDLHLCRALSKGGAEVVLFTRPVRNADYFARPLGDQTNGTPPGYRTSEHFYHFSERMTTSFAVRPLKRGLKAIEHVWNMATLLRRLRRLRPDIIHFQWTVVPAVDRCFVRRLRTVAPCVLTVHDTNAFLAPSSRWQRIGWDSILRAFDLLIVHTQASQRALVAKGIEETKISIIPHGVFDYPMNEDMNQRNLDVQTCVLLAFGSIKPYKGIDVLLRAMALLPAETRRNIRLVIAGNPGSLEGELRRLARELGVADSIEWLLRFIPDDEVSTLFRRCSAVVFPYRQIDASGALMTALPYGKAIIASRLGLFAELLDQGETAHFVEPGDPATLAAAIAEVAKNPADAGQMGQRAALLAETVLSWDRIAEMTLAAYRKLLSTADHCP